jgi:hypothetical protein
MLVVRSKTDSLLSTAPSQVHFARRIAVAARHIGNFMFFSRYSSLDDSSLRIAAALLLGESVCAPHWCM